MVNKTCVYKKCKSDSRRHPWIKWATFISPKVNRNLERAKKWIRLLGRPDFTIERINVHTFICEDHFPEKDHENLDWKRNPNLTPFPADHDIEKDNSKFVQGVKKPSEKEENIQNSTSNKVSRVFSWLPEGCSIHCLYNDCTSDMRLNPDLKWAEFVKPTNPNNIERASKWIDLIGRTDFTVTKINKYTYLCEKHFHEGVNLDWRKNAELEPFQINSEISVKEDPLSEKYLSKNVKEDSSNSLMVRTQNIFSLTFIILNNFLIFYTFFRKWNQKIHGIYNPFMTYNIISAQFAFTPILQNKNLFIMHMKFIQKQLKI